MAEEEIVEPTKEEEEENKPWFVAGINKEAYAEEKEILVEQIVSSGFKLQIEADKWVSDHAKEDVLYATLRRGKVRRVTVVRRLEEV